jgi:hypothetical protein
MSANSTYVGIEWSGAFSIHHKLPFLVRGSLGVSRRIQGAAGPGTTAFTWSVGVLVPVIW